MKFLSTYCDAVQIFIVIQIFTVIMSKLSIYLFTITQNIQETNQILRIFLR
jgi:hypothetical protein